MQVTGMRDHGRTEKRQARVSPIPSAPGVSTGVGDDNKHGAIKRL